MLCFSNKIGTKVTGQMLFCSLRFLNALTFTYFGFEKGTWWRLFDFHIFWLWGYLMKVIWLSHILALRVLDEGFDIHIFWLWGYLIKVIWLSHILALRVTDKGNLTFTYFSFEGTWWRLFDFLIFWLWVYLMKVIPEKHCVY